MRKSRVILICFMAFIVVFPSIFFPVFYLTPYTKPALVTSIVIDSVEVVGEPDIYIQCNLNVSLLFPNSCSSFKDYSIKLLENENIVKININAFHRPRNEVCLAIVTYLNITISIILFFGNWTIYCNNLSTDLVI